MRIWFKMMKNNHLLRERRIPLSSRLILIFWKCRLSRRIKLHKLWKEIKNRFQQAVFRFA